MKEKIENLNQNGPGEMLPTNEIEARQKEARELWTYVEALRSAYQANEDESELRKGLELIEKIIKEDRSISAGRLPGSEYVTFASGGRQPWEDDKGIIHRLGEK